MTLKTTMMVMMMVMAMVMAVVMRTTTSRTTRRTGREAQKLRRRRGETDRGGRLSDGKVVARGKEHGATSTTHTRTRTHTSITTATDLTHSSPGGGAEEVETDDEETLMPYRSDGNGQGWF